MEECPGEGACHGCMKWCDRCGDVAWVCDSATCDSHRREEEIRGQISELEAGIKEAASKCRKLEIWMRELRHSGADGGKTPRAASGRRFEEDRVAAGKMEASALAESMRSNEREVADLADDLRSLKFWESEGCRMVPRTG